MTDAEFRPAPKHLAMLAAEMRGWPYTDTDHKFYDAILAAHHAGWPWERICREAFRILLLEDATPDDLRLAARDPRRQEARPGPGLPTREDAVAAVAQLRAELARTTTPGQEGGNAA